MNTHTTTIDPLDITSEKMYQAECAGQNPDDVIMKLQSATEFLQLRIEHLERKLQKGGVKHG